jgi:hypothetical protein
VHLIRKVQLFPLQQGEYTLEPAEVESLIQLRNPRERNEGGRLRDLFRRKSHDPLLQKQMTFKSPEVHCHPQYQRQ